MEIEKVQEVASKLQSGATEFQAQADTLRKLLNGLEIAWQSPGAKAYLADATHVQTEMVRITELIAELQLTLQKEIEKWVQVGQQGEPNYRELPNDPVIFPKPLPVFDASNLKAMDSSPEG
jgi:uncharacterized protein YukE